MIFGRKLSQVSAKTKKSLAVVEDIFGAGDHLRMLSAEHNGGHTGAGDSKGICIALQLNPSSSRQMHPFLHKT